MARLAVAVVSRSSSSLLFLYPPPPASPSPLVCISITLSYSFTYSNAGQLLKGATDENGAQKSAALLVGIKLDLEAEVHLTARVKGDICIGLY
jgi:hypothetical protein